MNLVTSRNIQVPKILHKAGGCISGKRDGHDALGILTLLE